VTTQLTITADAPPIESRGARRARVDAATVALLGICVGAAALRFATLGSQSFDYDESFTVGILHGSLGHTLHRLPITESTPPLYYVLAWLWTRAFGLSAFGVRSLSAVLGVVLIPVAFLTARSLGSRRAPLIAAVLVAVNPFLVWYSQEARAYALLALLSTLSFWAFLRALRDPTPPRMALWALASAAAVLSHYFALYLVAAEAVWLIVATRRRSAIAASAAVAAVGAALIPLVISQADNRTQWIETLSLWSRIKEVAKKWATGEIAPTRNWELALVAVLAGGAVLYAATRLTTLEREGAGLALGIGGAALLIPLVLDVAGLHYLISKNVTPALPVLLIALAVILGAERAGIVGLAGAAVLGAFFLAITIDGAIDPALQRPDYRAAARALGAPARDQVVVTPNLGGPPLALYRGGATTMPSGWPATELMLVEPLPRADVSSVRAATPAAPPGFTFRGRVDARTYTLICFGSTAPRSAPTASLLALAGTVGASAQVWPRAGGRGDALTARLCGVS
jgi:hypothetical protein